MGRALESILQALAEFAGIEFAKFALGDFFAYLAVAFMLSTGLAAVLGWLSTSSRLARMFAFIPGKIANVLFAALIITCFLIIWGGGLFLLIAGY